MVIDASAIVAVLAEEPLAETVLAALDANPGPVAVSPLTVFEAALGLARARTTRNQLSTREGIETALAAVEHFLRVLRAEEVPVSPVLSRAAIAAAARYGRAVRHPANLNFGDCFSYALAASRGDGLLFIGADFIETDAQSVLANPRPHR